MALILKIVQESGRIDNGEARIRGSAEFVWHRLEFSLEFRGEEDAI
jgi:hypothetical protein